MCVGTVGSGMELTKRVEFSEGNLQFCLHFSLLEKLQ